MKKKLYFVLALIFSLIPFSKSQAAGICPETLCHRCECIGDGIVRETDKMYDGEIIHTYDIYGRKISTQNNLEDHQEYGQYTTYTYDVSNNITSVFRYESKEDTEPKSYEISTYDSDGRLESKTYFRYDKYGDPDTYQFQYTYDANGRVVSETYYDDPVAEQTVYSYDDGHTETTYDISGGTPILKSVFTAACDGDSKDNHYCDHMYTYFENGQMDRQTVYADYIGHGEFETEEERNCKTCNCCEPVTPLSPADIIAYNPNPEIVCVTGYSPSCNAGTDPISVSQTQSEPKRRIYTVEEAAAVVKPGATNTFKLRYR